MKSSGACAARKTRCSTRTMRMPSTTGCSRRPRTHSPKHARAFSTRLPSPEFPECLPQPPRRSATWRALGKPAISGGTGSRLQWAPRSSCISSSLRCAAARRGPLTMQLIDLFPFVPILFGLLTLLVPRGNQWVRILPILGALVTFGVSLGFAVGFFALGETATTSSTHPWIGGPWSAAYHVRVDAISIFFVLLTTFVSVPSIWAAWSYPDATRLRGFLFLLLAFESTLLGLFTAAD